MLKWCKHYYVGEAVRDAEKIRSKIEQGRLTPGIYLLTLSENPHHLMELIPAITLKQEAVRMLCPEIIGIASGKDEALSMASAIIQEIYEKTGAFQVREYMKNR